MSKGKIRKKLIPKTKRAKIIALCGLVFLVMPTLTFGAYSAKNYNNVYSRQFIGQTDLGGKSKLELEKALTDKSDRFAKEEIKLKTAVDGKEKTFSLKPEDIGFHYDVQATADKIWQVGHNSDISNSFWQQLRSAFVPTYHQAVYTYSDDLLKSKIAAIAKEIDSPEKDFAVVYKSGKFQLSEDRSPGKRLNRDKLTSAIKDRMGKIESSEIVFTEDEYAPQVSEENANSRLRDANRILNGGDLIVQYDAQQFKFDPEMIGGVIKSRVKSNDLELFFDDARLDAFVDSIAAAVNVEPANAKLKVADGKAAIFQLSKEGKTVVEDQTKEEIEKALLLRTTGNAIQSPQTVMVVVDVKKPEITENDINTLGITELVGTGMTNFKGSPANRIHNIQTGAAALNGILLKPDETFSTLAKLGEISDKSGYLPELVIKEDKTVPEFGGGLCQVSTTLYRAALNAGMKILERQNHKYRVSYYEPPVGMDATIYDPAPDFRFLNNYASHILIQSRVEGTKITFDLYGTKDGRVAEIGASEVYDIVEPGPRINVETDTLAPGEEKQIEKAHQGASAKFHYKVTKDGQTLQETDFLSKYVPWPEKWMVGKQPTPPPEATPAPAPESTPVVQ